MNIGQKIKTLRENNNMSIEELAKKINDSVENLLKYENNELEPTLDKKLALSIPLGVTLSDLSYSIEQKVANVNDNVLDQTEGSVLEETLKKVDLEEIPFASSNIIYSENIFNKIFKKDYQRYFIQFMISFFGYLLVGVYAIVSKFNIIAYICFGFAAYAVIKIIFTLIRFKNGKKEWLEQYNNVKKEYQYYNEYIKITSDDIRYPEITFNYKDIIRAIEKEGLIVCMVNSEQKTIVTIDKNTLDDESLIKVRTSIQKNCPNYINIEQMQLQKQNVNKKTRILNGILWSLTILSVLVLFIIKFIFNLTNSDNTLLNQIIVYLVALIFPIVSIIMGIVAYKKYQFKSSKNIIVGAIVGIICLFNIGLVLMNHKILTSKNNNQLIETIKNTTQTQMPRDYYTIYFENELDSITNDDIHYNIETYQIWTFNKKAEIEELENSIKNNFNWKSKNDDINYKNIFPIYEDAKKMLTNLGYEFVENADYFLVLNLNQNKVGNLDYENGDKYVILSYYDSSNYLLAVEFTCLVLSE